jgi:hypothetical protein
MGRDSHPAPLFVETMNSVAETVHTPVGGKRPAGPKLPETGSPVGATSDATDGAEGEVDRWSKVCAGDGLGVAVQAAKPAQSAQRATVVEARWSSPGRS